MIRKFYLLLSGIVFLSANAFSQGFPEGGQVHGDFVFDAQLYQTDEKLGITDSTLDGNIFGMNAYGNIIYTNGDFSAGLRYEAYLPPLSGFDKRYEGHGVPYWFARYDHDKVDITVGHFYEQFGNGLVLRSYQEWALGFDNNINGVRLKVQPFNGVYIKALAGTQRFFWDPFEDNNRAIIKGLDGEIYLNDLISKWRTSRTRIIIGGSFVSKYQQVTPRSFLRDTVRYEYKIPDNVAAYAGRINLLHGGFNLNAEYARKINDPSSLNNFIYKDGEALYTSISYSTSGFGIILTGKRIDNMSFKSDIYDDSYASDINFLPPLGTQYVYSLATMYPYATQPNGEIGVRGKIYYTIPKKSWLGGKYGTKFEFSYSRINSLDKERVEPNIPIDSTGTLGYKSNFTNFGDVEYYRDFAVKINKKINPKWKFILEYINLKYNIDVIEGHPGEPMVKAHIGIADVTYKINRKNAIRFEYQQLLSKQDRGEWLMAMLEYSISPRWFFSIMDEYNYGNPNEDMQLHYYTASVAYVKDATRVSLSYGRQREGLICVGGVCRMVPASNGLSISITSSF
ncbi:MAG: DUF6029 family protein [Bacteroidales bacterium]|nr:DUF6029 family protein [Bacteroidales bacterium]MCF8344356.1 DUF6029 family protein [Bacteroidales bacterium]MCF8351675.1 DUF6029 family protein [Bacteroidales bacterium]MCF8376246.1 DUF6029 family protein [Bacteroidales bacterium]MCF8401197.1 DUF6029 family protein [Bacteroidales bacterium]